MLTADVVAIAIVTASRIWNTDPLMVIGAERMYHQDQVLVSRARSYAALALDEVLNKGCGPNNYRVPRMAIGRAVGAAPSNQTMVANIRGNIKNGYAKWWKEGDFRQVCAAVAAEIERMGLVGPLPPPVQPSPKPKNVDSVATTTIARPRVDPPPKERPAPPPAPTPATPAPIVKDAPMCVGGVTVDIRTRTVGANGKSVKFEIEEVVKMIAALVRVMPALLPNDRISKAIWGEPRANTGYVLPGLAEQANRGLEMIGLRIRNMPKAGYSISKA